MITIEQLLESVDLDFEPRWVTKDLNGIVNIWSEKPHRRSSDWNCSAYATVYEGLKLAEFEGKNWTECIYEVPRKTTGKIERFTLDDFATVVDVGNCVRSVLDSRVFDKLNELVDTVNELKGAKND